MEQEQTRIYNPDDVIGAYSRCLGRDLFYQKVTRQEDQADQEIPIRKCTAVNELMPPL